MSARLLRPFLEILAKYPEFPAEAQQTFNPRNPDARIPMPLLLDWLTRAETVTGEPQLGLKAGAAVQLGDCGALAYAMRSAPTTTDALTLATQTSRVLSDALVPRMQVHEGRAMVWVDGALELTRPAQDFVAGMARQALLEPGLPERSRMIWCFPYEQPENLAEHWQLFGSRLRFATSFLGFVCDAEALDAPLPQADPILHAILKRSLDTELKTLTTKNGDTAERVHQLLAVAGPAQDFPPSAEDVARSLGMSRRTLSRHLHREGVSYHGLVDGVRRQRAILLLSERDAAIEEVAFALGFADLTSFYRAFRRWTGTTPHRYRLGQTEAMAPSQAG